MSSKSGGRPDRSWVADTVLRIQHGGRLEQDYERLFREYEPLIRGCLLRRGWTGPELDDLVQDVLLRVYRGIGSFHYGSSFDTWVLRIMVNAWINALRKRSGRAQEVSLDDRPQPGDDPGPVLSEPIDPGNDPFDQILITERRQRLQAALDGLPPRMRQCLLFRYHGYRHEEIARAQGCSVATVRKQVQNAYKRLRVLDPLIEVLGLLAVLIPLLR